MRRGQLLSFDALLAIVIVIFMLGAVSATSDNLKAGITNLLGWYDRTSVPDTMLDVLLQSAGTPPNWNENVSALVVPGLRASSGQYVDYNKAVTFFDLLKNNDSRVENALLNLSLGRPFLLDFYLGKWSFEANFTWNPNAGGGIPPGFEVYNGSCSIRGNAQLTFDNPTILPCDPLDVRGAAHLVASSDFCIVGSVGVDTRGSITVDVGHYPPYQEYPYLAIGGDWRIIGAGTVHVAGNTYVLGALIVRGEGSRTINIAKDLIIYGDTTNPYVIDIAGASATITVGIAGYSPGNVYVRVNGVWYASNQTGVWYKKTSTGWEKVSGTPAGIILPSTVLTVNGYPLSPDWVPPAPPECLNIGTGQPLTVSSLLGNYTYPQQLSASEAWNRVSYMNASFLVNPTNVSSVLKARANASWVSYSERNTVISMFQYNRTTTIVGNASGIILAGVLRYDIPDYAMLRVDVPAESGYVLLVAVDGGTLKAIGFWKTSPEDALNAEVWESSGGNVSVVATYRGSNTSVTIPWGVIFSGPAGFGRPVMLYLYSNGFTGPVTLTDEGDIGVLMTPMYEPLLVKLWVWDEP
ncbi:conserved protein of unknown function [Thermococcus nautili]|uniref:hypothetical protein n=1 Tax=Thermococcus nautili TaxID=195522 RepID=UPI0025556071|nr:hypothetical protein [Thermococcus nautili]CAI1492408.1 conserved protein of unknown function [Thermococcus nautili]